MRALELEIKSPALALEIRSLYLSVMVSLDVFNVVLDTSVGSFLEI